MEVADDDVEFLLASHEGGLLPCLDPAEVEGVLLSEGGQDLGGGRRLVRGLHEVEGVHDGEGLTQR